MAPFLRHDIYLIKCALYTKFNIDLNLDSFIRNSYTTYFGEYNKRENKGHTEQIWKRCSEYDDRTYDFHTHLKYIIAYALPVNPM